MVDQRQPLHDRSALKDCRSVHKHIMVGQKCKAVKPPHDQPLIASTTTSTSMRPILATSSSTKTGRAALAAYLAIPHFRQPTFLYEWAD